GPGMNLRDSRLQEGYDPSQLNPPSQAVPSVGPDGRIYPPRPPAEEMPGESFGGSFGGADEMGDPLPESMLPPEAPGYCPLPQSFVLPVPSQSKAGQPDFGPRAEDTPQRAPKGMYLPPGAGPVGPALGPPPGHRQPV